jgi:hypothetical protein
MVSPGCFLCNLRAKAEEIVEHRAYSKPTECVFWEEQGEAEEKVEYQTSNILAQQDGRTPTDDVIAWLSL